jgi:hypothetical protein
MFLGMEEISFGFKVQICTNSAQPLRTAELTEYQISYSKETSHVFVSYARVSRSLLYACVRDIHCTA